MFHRCYLALDSIDLSAKMTLHEPILLCKLIFRLKTAWELNETPRNKHLNLWKAKIQWLYSFISKTTEFQCSSALLQQQDGTEAKRMEAWSHDVMYTHKKHINGSGETDGILKSF